jgi:hypothetical protein
MSPLSRQIGLVVIMVVWLPGCDWQSDKRVYTVTQEDASPRS